MAEEMSTDPGTKVLFENDRIRVWEMKLGPGETSHAHKHMNDYVFIYSEPSTIETDFLDGRLNPRSYEEGFTCFSAVGASGLDPHRIRNLADEPHRHVIVEILGPSSASEPQPPEDNGRVTDL
jgi:beta-alanine degradation protein BauB